MVAVSPVLVGRAAEVAVLDESWAQVRSGSPATVLIGGEAGIGKTRLVRHFSADLEAEVRFEADSAARFFTRHLGRARTSPA
jgi:predicted ATPase